MTIKLFNALTIDFLYLALGKRVDRNLADCAPMLGPPVARRCILIVMGASSFIISIADTQLLDPRLARGCCFTLRFDEGRLIEHTWDHGVGIVSATLEVFHLLLIHDLLHLSHIALQTEHLLLLELLVQHLLIACLRILLVLKDVLLDSIPDGSALLVCRFIVVRRGRLLAW